MAKFEEHMEDCRKNIKPELWALPATQALCAEVNHKIDQFAHTPDGKFFPRHRMYLHHMQGLEWFKLAYGELGYLIAFWHVLLDCAGKIPDMKEYNAKLDEFGLPWY